MARGDQLARQWKIIQSLISARRGKTVPELASEMDCNRRTVYRDLEALQAAGFPIYNERVEGRSLWSFLDNVKHQVPIPFSLMELMALYFGRDMLRVLKNTVFYESIESLFQKIKATLSPEYINYLNTIEQSIHVGLKPYKPYGELKTILNGVNDAVVNKKIIEIVYFSMQRKKKTRRRIAPYKIWFFDGTFYVIGHCLLRNGIRIFALDRIKALRQTEETFVVPEDFEVETFMKSSFGVFVGKPVRVRVWFSSDAAGYVREKIWHETQKIDTQDDGSIIFEAEVAGIDEIKFWIMNWGSKAMVLEPESLKKEIRTEAEAMFQRYSKTE